MTLKGSAILLVEDNADDEELTIEALKENRIENEILVAHDGQEALDFLFGNPEKNIRQISPQLVLLDLKLPKCRRLLTREID